MVCEEERMLEESDRFWGRLRDAPDFLAAYHDELRKRDKKWKGGEEPITVRSKIMRWVATYYASAGNLLNVDLVSGACHVVVFFGLMGYAGMQGELSFWVALAILLNVTIMPISDGLLHDWILERYGWMDWRFE